LSQASATPAPAGAGSASLYEEVAQLQAGQPWGHFLDAGTGRASLSWLLGQETEAWTAVTGSPAMLETVRQHAGDRLRAQDRLVLGNWMDAELLHGERYDTVLADYLLGAIEGFAPYWQDRLFARLRPLVRRRLYVIGLEPYVSRFPDDPAGAIVTAIGRLRDACLLLAGETPYREYPLEWVLRQLRSSGFRTLDVRRYPIRYGPRFIDSQLDMCTQRLGRLRDRQLALSLMEHVQDLRARAHALCSQEQGLRHGHDYLILAEPDMR
jgi:hypothetical protein